MVPRLGHKHGFDSRVRLYEKPPQTRGFDVRWLGPLVYGGSHAVTSDTIGTRVAQLPDDTYATFVTRDGK
jgi:hypothetical protein